MKRVLRLKVFLWERFRKLSFKKKIAVFVLVLIVVSFGSGYFSKGKDQYALEKVKRDTVIEYVTETGSIIDEGSTKVYSPTNGTVVELYVENGDSVAVGDELFKVVSTATEEEKQEASAAYFKASSDQAAASANSNSLRSSMYSAWESFRDLATDTTYQDGSGNPKAKEREATEFQTLQDDWLAAEKLYKNSQTQISAAAAAASAANLAYQATQNAVVKATGNGMIQNISISKGGKVQANIQTVLSSSTVGPALLITTSKTRIKALIGQSDVAKVKPGQKVILDPDAYQDIEFEGVVERVDEIGVETSGVVGYGVYIALVKSDDRLKTGMTFDAEIETEKVDNALTVNNSAVVLYKGGRAVRVKGKNSEIEYVPVAIGLRGNERTQILKGVSDNQEVITSLSNEQVKRPGLF